MAASLFPGPPVLLYDDACGWCRGWSGWLAERASTLRLAPLSGETARALLPDGAPSDTLVLVHTNANEVIRDTRSRALLLALATLGGPWRLAGWIACLPRWLIDPPYLLLARHRHRLAGSAPRCPLPSTKESRHLP